ncbi:hypothetical protein THAOC_35300 [Thalassiosira oceanica]|uniref:Uncharacterized protein n=1 Tax=Thalassiosira oceanica TaxID=159749 RepID=K0R148_THAOC|nr:hypothetical protein THAOC_35300 [Thalassiosira oceanica]|eukprot:EJK46058.1 hypothetical protein THAOC_35300 [Thalassiosira oceanica]
MNGGDRSAAIGAVRDRGHDIEIIALPYLRGSRVCGRGVRPKIGRVRAWMRGGEANRVIRPASCFIRSPFNRPFKSVEEIGTGRTSKRDERDHYI